MKRKIYIAGKVTGLPKKEVEILFNRADRLITSLGHISINPTKIIPSSPNNMTDEEAENFWIKAMEVLLPEVMRADYIYMIPNWCESKGARIEHNLAVEMEKMIIYADESTAQCSDNWEFKLEKLLKND